MYKRLQLDTYEAIVTNSAKQQPENRTIKLYGFVIAAAFQLTGMLKFKANY